MDKLNLTRARLESIERKERTRALQLVLIQPHSINCFAYVKNSFIEKKQQKKPHNIHKTLYEDPIIYLFIFIFICFLINVIITPWKIENF